MSIISIQSTLKLIGIDPGPIDGRWGPQTRNAVMRFQKSAGLEVDGIVGKDTLKALSNHTGSVLQFVEPIWLTEAKKWMGLSENDPRIKEFLESDGHTVGDPSKVPWCGDFVDTCIRLTLPNEPTPSNPYLALNWMKFGVMCPEPVVGAIAVFWRGSPSSYLGHVGFIDGQDERYLSVIGGNQSNSVTRSRIEKYRLRGMRYPKTAGRIAVGPMGTATGPITRNEA